LRRANRRRARSQQAPQVVDRLALDPIAIVEDAERDLGRAPNRAQSLLRRWKSCSRGRIALEAFGVAVLAIVWVGMSQNVP
jgi:hypothetical protein